MTMLDRETNIPLALVVAMARNHVIGKDGALPWRLADDLKWFKKVTTGKPVIMGRRTYESIGKALPNRDNIVVTSRNDFAATEVTAANGLTDAIAIAEAFAISRAADEICVIGGSMVYTEALPLAHKIYLTEICADVDGDTEFPLFPREEWTEEEVGNIKQDDRNDHDARMLILERKPAG